MRVKKTDEYDWAEDAIASYALATQTLRERYLRDCLSGESANECLKTLSIQMELERRVHREYEKGTGSLCLHAPCVTLVHGAGRFDHGQDRIKLACHTRLIISAAQSFGTRCSLAPGPPSSITRGAVSLTPDIK